MCSQHNLRDTLKDSVFIKTLCKRIALCDHTIYHVLILMQFLVKICCIQFSIDIVRDTQQALCVNQSNLSLSKCIHSSQLRAARNTLLLAIGRGRCCLSHYSGEHFINDMPTLVQVEARKMRRLSEMISDWGQTSRPSFGGFSQNLYSFARRESLYIARKKLAGLKVSLKCIPFPQRLTSITY